MDIKAEMAERRAGDPAVLIASSDKAKNELGWNTKYNSLETIIATAWGWEITYKKGRCHINES